MQSINKAFSSFAQWVSRWSGRTPTFILAIAVVLVWGATGPLFHYSDTWQLVINTGTTIVTFLMVFLIQNTQNRDTAAIQLKLDELIRVNQRASNNMLNLENLSDQELEQLKGAFARLGDRHPEAREELDDVTEELDDAKEKLAAIGAGRSPAHAR
jgi:low affinity Fe/Cu permease